MYKQALMQNLCILDLQFTGMHMTFIINLLHNEMTPTYRHSI